MAAFMRLPGHDTPKMNLDWNDVLHFVTLARHQTLSAAAEALGVQHSTVSRRIARLEKSLGLRLFHRMGKRHWLTEDGQRIHEHACELYKDMQGLQRLAHEQATHVGDVVVSAPPVILRHGLMPHLPAFFRRDGGKPRTGAKGSVVQGLSPQSRIRLVLQGSADLSDLHGRQADIALRLVRPSQNDLVVQRLRSIRFGFFAHPGYLKRTARQRRAFLMLSTVNPQQAWAKQLIGEADILLCCNDFELIRQAARQRMGIGFLPHLCVQPDDGLVPVVVNGRSPEVLEETLYLVMHEDVRHSPRVRAVADFLVSVLAA